jgi:N-acetylglucosamine-6-phosphate deacetylase
VSFVLRAETLVTPDGALSPGWLAASAGVITGLGGGPGPPPAAGPAVELGARTVAPGYFDVHVHGGDGAQVNGDSVEEVVESLRHIARFHARHGTTSLLATTVSDSAERLATTVGGVAAAMRHGIPGGAAIRGIHLEGPWLARAKMGAQDPRSLRLPDVAELRSLAAMAEGCIRMVTVAPELPESEALIAAACDLGIRVAIGHTDASYETTLAAIAAGARHATHLFNAMTPLHHRRPGAVAAVLLDDRVTVELIADLEHVHPAVMALVQRCAAGRVVAVSDAVSAAGLEPGRYQLGRLEVSVAEGRVTLADDPSTLAGSLLTIDEAVRNLVTAAGLPLVEALRAASATPARAAGLSGHLGEIRVGAPADLVVLGPDLRVTATVAGGDVVFDPSGILSALL